MANNCYTSYTIRGDHGNVKAFMKKVKELYEKKEVDLVDLGMAFGISEEECRELGARGDICDFEAHDNVWNYDSEEAPKVNENGNIEYPTIAIDSAWYPQEELMAEIFRKAGVYANWYAEEPGCEVYLKEDIDGDYPQEFVYDDSDVGVVYYESLEKLCDDNGVDFESLEDEDDLDEVADKIKEVIVSRTEVDINNLYIVIHRVDDQT